ncbi:alpha/beta fold hydrolase [Clostridium sp. BSD9I1]|uniref:alpha/beta fold hydrolase n=1 Tax=Clostridium sp. BSD9I1 TaxID=2003589 RepID=UPI0016443AD1|nr:alpha/beta hydrolase [Clostridium sp. BSD9I1]
MSINNTGILSVPGASLYYEVRGSGPVLLMIHGGNGDADVYHGIAEQLSYKYTVVTYDRGGYSRSKLTNENEDYSIKVHSEDAYRLLTELNAELAYVFGSSAGAVIGLDLAIRHPEKISILIAHEPPLTHLLSGEEQIKARQIQENLENTACSEGAIPAMKQFASVLGIKSSNNSAYIPSAEHMKRMIENMKSFVMYEAPAIRRHILNLEDLRFIMNTSSLRIVTGYGGLSQGTFPNLCAIALAEQLRVENMEFPGNHLGYVSHSKEFAERLHDALENEMLKIET